MVSRLLDQGVKSITLDSSGNAGAAVATYCAAAGIACDVFVPYNNSPGKLAQISAVGGALRRVHGSRADTSVAARQSSEANFYASHNWSADFGAGLSTVAIELFEQLGHQAPTSVLAPCGNGGVILGLHRGFTSLVKGGHIDKVPRLIAVQSSAFDAVSNAFGQGLAEVEPRGEGGITVAEGIASTLPVRGRQLLEAVRQSQGAVITVSEGEIANAAIELASSGVYVEPTGAVGIAGLRQLQRNAAQVLLGDSPVVMLTGSGLKAGSKVAEMKNPNWLLGDG